MRLEEELKNYLVCDLAAAKIQKNLAQLQAKRLLLAIVLLAVLAATSTGISIGIVWWVLHRPMKPLLFV